jgi:hypothetical protein
MMDNANRKKIEELAIQDRDEEWKVLIKGGRIFFTRMINGRLEESYRPMNTNEASVAAVSIIQGYQPPRSLTRLDKPAG